MERLIRESLIYLIFFLSISFASKINIPVIYDTLQNGLRIIIVPDSTKAVVSCRLYYFVGSMYEGPGTTGLSHMYEHMMFKGTKTLGTKNYEMEIPIMKKIDSLEEKMVTIQNKNIENKDSILKDLHNQIMALIEKQRAYIKKDEIWELYETNGGTMLNAWTSDDMTAYIVTLPYNKIELFYWIESDRMSNPVLREFYSEKMVVLEERRMRYENRPIGKYWERLNALFFIAHPFRQPTIGWMSDIRSFTRKKMEEHVKRYYTPDNALIILVGRVEPQKALKDINRYFGRIPRAEKPKQEVVTREPEPAGVVRFTMKDDGMPRIDFMFHTPGYPNEDLYRLDVVEGIFSGRSGRLYKRLVTQEGLCTNAGANNEVLLHNGCFHIWAELKSNADPNKVETIIKEEIKKISEKPPTEQEMKRIRNSIQMSFVSGLKSMEGLSDRLAYFERLNSWRDLFSYPDKIASVKAEEVPMVVAKYLDPERATIGMLLAKDSVKKIEKEENN